MGRAVSRLWWGTLAVALLALGCGLLAQAVGTTSPTPPLPDAAATVGVAAPQRPAAPLPGSTPVRLAIPSLGITSSLLRLGLNPDRTLAVPAPGPTYNQAAWYTGSPTPGQVGPAVIVGHVDSAAQGPSVFYRLGALQPGAEVDVTRADGTVAVFGVDRLAVYPKAAFPTATVYGDTSGPELRLITCGGRFDQASGAYVSNTVVYAHLVTSHT
jgi:sortase (surface protein transpeptidase)